MSLIENFRSSYVQIMTCKPLGHTILAFCQNNSCFENEEMVKAKKQDALYTVVAVSKKMVRFIRNRAAVFPWDLMEAWETMRWGSNYNTILA